MSFSHCYGSPVPGNDVVVQNNTHNITILDTPALQLLQKLTI